MFQKINTWAIVALAVLALALSGVVWYLYHKTTTTEAKLQLSSEILVQNKLYAVEIKQKADSIFALTGMVEKLNTTVLVNSKEWTMQKASYITTIKELKQQGSGVVSTGTDPYGAFGMVTFDSSVSIVHFKGNTKYYLNGKKSSYGINLLFDPVTAASRFYKDVNGYWKLQTESKTPGVTIFTDYVIDSTFYSSIGDLTFTPEETIKPSDVFGVELNGMFGGTISAVPDYKSHVFDLSNASVYYNNINVAYFPFIKSIAAGYRYKLDLTKAAKFLNTVLTIF